MDTAVQKILDLMNKYGVTKRKLERELKLNRKTLSRLLEEGETNAIRSRMALDIFKWFDMKFVNQAGQVGTQQNFVPLIGEIPAGKLEVNEQGIKKAKPPLTKEVQLELLKCARGKEVWPLIVMALGCGLRPIELVRVKPEDIDHQRGLITANAKNTQRMVPMSARVSEELKKSTAWVGGVYSAHDALWLIRKENGLPDDVTLQALRRTAAFRISQEVDLMTYARIMGHSLQVAKDHYLDFSVMGEASKAHILKPENWPRTGRFRPNSDWIPTQNGPALGRFRNNHRGKALKITL